MVSPDRTSPSPSSYPGFETSAPLLPPSAVAASRSSPRWSLLFQALLWRFFARIGFFLHTLPKPRPPAPSFSRSYSTELIHGTQAADLDLAFYVPDEYHHAVQRGKQFPVVVNFHGGGFTLGRYSDDARWAAIVAREVTAVVVCVTYRLAPEHPFPTAVEDGVCALLHLSANAESLGIDAKRMTLSGFSAGGNLAFTVPLYLHTYIRSVSQPMQLHRLPPLPQIISIIAWYPGVDSRLTRAERRATNPRPSKNLPPVLTNLFDASYFPDPTSAASPFASPAAADHDETKTSLPDDIYLFLCEWDMLTQEGKDYAEYLQMLGKRVRLEVIKERQHGFDKSPWPFKLDGKVTAHYKQACDWLQEIHGRTQPW